MRVPEHGLRKTGTPVVWLAVAALAVAIGLAVPPLQAGDDEETTFDGLVLMKSTRTTQVYRKPDVDFAGYARLMILPCEVAFRKDWARDYNRSRGGSVSSKRVTGKDMTRIKEGIADLFEEVFAKEFGEKGGYPIVTEPAADTLVLKPAIINLKVTAPDLDPLARTQVRSAGEGTLFLEMIDSVSGEILARAVDRRADPERHYWQWATKLSNRAAAERIMRQWASQLREAFDAAHDGEVARKDDSGDRH
jgi:hypothetical protein